MTIKKLLAASLSAVMLSGFTALTPVSAEAEDITVNAEEVTIYGLDTCYSDEITIPEEYPQSFQLEVTGAEWAYFGVEEGVSLSLDYSKGLIEPEYTSTYNFSTGEDYETADYGDAAVKIIADKQEFLVNVHVVDYFDIHVQKEMDKIAAEILSDEQTDLEKIQTITKYVAETYDYSVYYSSAYGMMINGGGDCWASTDMIIKLCESAGIHAWVRDARWSGGSGHMNAMTCIDGTYYIMEAGYTGEAPRSWSVQEADSLYRYTSVDGGVEIFGYSGEELPEILEIPDNIGGEPVVSIGEEFLYGSWDENVKKIIIPDTVKSISDYTFSDLPNLESVEIPASVESIGSYSFKKCLKLTEFIVAEDNPCFCSENGILYNKDKTILIGAPAVAEAEIPSSVTEICGSAFRYNENLTSITIPSSVKTMGTCVFAECYMLRHVTIESGGITSIPDYTFYYDGIEELRIPADVTEIGTSAIAKKGGIRTSSTSISYMPGISTCVYTTEGSAAAVYADENSIPWVAEDHVHELTLSESTEANCWDDGCYTYTCSGCSYIHNEVKPEDSDVHSYLRKLKYENATLDAGGYIVYYCSSCNKILIEHTEKLVSMDECTAALDAEEFHMNSEYFAQYPDDTDMFHPPVTVAYGGETLTEGTDYTLSYYSDGNKPCTVGINYVDVTGKGRFSGTATLSYTLIGDITMADKTGFDEESYSYTGKEIVPQGWLILSDYYGTLLVKDEDYTIECTGNIEPGLASAVIKGIGNYEGEIEIEFEITDDMGYKGDVNTDSKVTVSDAVRLQKYLVCTESLDSVQMSRGDINCDGRVNIFDMILLKGMLA